MFVTVGWGYDFWYDNYALLRVPGHKMGIVSSIRVKHDQDLKASVRTDNTKVEDKWKAVVAQEKFYQTHLNIKLQKFREKMRLKNSTLTGAVIGYLRTPPIDFRGNRLQLEMQAKRDECKDVLMKLKSHKRGKKARTGNLKGSEIDVKLIADY